MLQISEQQILERLDSLPTDLHDELFNVSNGQLVWDVCRAHHLSDEKAGLVLDLVSDVMYGFSHYSDLARDIKNELNIDAQIANAIAQEIDEKLFSKFGDDLKKAYNPVFSTGEVEPKPTTTRPKTIFLRSLDVNAPSTEESEAQPEITITTPKAPKAGEPLIISREETLTEEKKPSFKKFSFPGFFKAKKTEPESQPAVKVKIETPDKEKRVVHYSEFRTPIMPFNEGNEFINLENFSKKANEPTGTSSSIVELEKKKEEPAIQETEIAPVIEPATDLKEVLKTSPQEKPAKNTFWFPKPKNAESQSALATAKPVEKSKGQASIEGNIIDLR